MKKYIVCDLFDQEFSEFEKKEDALKELKEIIEFYKDNEEGLDNMARDLFIAEKTVIVEEKIIACKKDYTDKEWEKAGYSLDFDRIIDLEIKDLEVN